MKPRVSTRDSQLQAYFRSFPRAMAVSLSMVKPNAFARARSCKRFRLIGVSMIESDWSSLSMVEPMIHLLGIRSLWFFSAMFVSDGGSACDE